MKLKLNWDKTRLFSAINIVVECAMRIETQGTFSMDISNFVDCDAVNCDC